MEVQNKSPKKTFLIDKDYSRLSRQQINDNLNQDFLLPQQLELSLNDQNYILSIASISASINSDQTADSILGFYLYEEDEGNRTCRSEKLQVTFIEAGWHKLSDKIEYEWQ